MAKIKIINRTIETKDGDRKEKIAVFNCPACNLDHEALLDYSEAKDAKERNARFRHTFNGNVNKPTFKDGIVHTNKVGGVEAGRCHSFIKDGLITYQGDCMHAHAGETMALKDL